MTCPTNVPIDLTLFPWKAPAAIVGSCTSADLTALVTYLDMNAGAKYADWKASVVNAACASCIFGKETDVAWHPLLENAAGELVKVNSGGCIAIASGNIACGKSYQNMIDCRRKACADCPAGTLAMQKCLSSESNVPCKQALDAVGMICGDVVVANAEAACLGDKFSFEGPIKAQCIGGIP